MAIVRRNRYFPSFFDDENWLEPMWQGVDLNSGIDIYETETSVVVEAQIPGIPEDKVDISIEGNVLTVDASLEETKEEKDEKRTVYRESRQRSFHYSVNLPRGVNPDKAEASVEKGVLKVEIPVTEEEKRKKIEIKSKK